MKIKTYIIKNINCKEYTIKELRRDVAISLCIVKDKFKFGRDTYKCKLIK